MGLALGLVGKTMRFPGGEGHRARGQVKFRDALCRFRTEEPPAPAAEALSGRDQINPAVSLALGPVSRDGVGKAQAAILGSHVAWIADGGPVAAGVGVRPGERAARAIASADEALTPSASMSRLRPPSTVGRRQIVRCRCRPFILFSEMLCRSWFFPGLISGSLDLENAC